MVRNPPNPILIFNAATVLTRFVSTGSSLGSPEGPSTQIVGFQGPNTIQSIDFGT